MEIKQKYLNMNGKVITGVEEVTPVIAKEVVSE